MAEIKVTVRLSASHAALLDKLAESHGGSYSATLRHLIEQGQGRPTGRMDTDDLMDLLEEQARAGSVAATGKLLTLREQERADADLRRLNAITTGRDT